MVADKELGEAAAEGDEQRQRHTENAHRPPFHLPPRQPAGDKADETPAYGMAAGVAVDRLGIGERERGSGAVPGIQSAPMGDRRREPPHSQIDFETGRMRYLPYLWAGERGQAHINLARHRLREILLAQ